jgi:hypothetical protein
MSGEDAYRLSRIQAEGWNRARTGSSDDLGALDPAAVEELCPYREDPEKARWLAGFHSAFK